MFLEDFFKDFERMVTEPRGLFEHAFAGLFRAVGVLMLFAIILGMLSAAFAG